MKKISIACAIVAATALAFSVQAADDADMPSSEELDAMTAEINEGSFHDKGIIKVKAVMQSMEEPLLATCARAGVEGEALDRDTMKKLEQEQMETIQWPEDGNFLGDWQAGETLAQSGRGGTWKDKADDPAGGNCYNCHRISSEELSFGTIGPSLYNYNKTHGITDPNDTKSAEMVKYTWGKIYNAKAYDACSNMPRFGSHDILTQDQIRDLMALLLDPESPVNE